jgi:hypothetical protein
LEDEERGCTCGLVQEVGRVSGTERSARQYPLTSVVLPSPPRASAHLDVLPAGHPPGGGGWGVRGGINMDLDSHLDNRQLKLSTACQKPPPSAPELRAVVLPYAREGHRLGRHVEARGEGLGGEEDLGSVFCVFRGQLFDLPPKPHPNNDTTTAPTLTRLSWNSSSTNSLRMGSSPEWWTPMPRLSMGRALTI